MSSSKCPFHFPPAAPTPRIAPGQHSLKWPSHYKPLHPAPASAGVESDGCGASTAEHIQKAHFAALKKNLAACIDRLAGLVAGGRYGHYGGLFIRHGVARRRHLPHRRTVATAHRQPAFAPLNNWPDSKQPRQRARRLCQPIKQKYGNAAFPGPTCSSSPATSRWRPWMGFRTAVLGGGRGPTSGAGRHLLGCGEAMVCRSDKADPIATAASTPAENPLAAVQMGLTLIRRPGTAIPTRSPPVAMPKLRAHGDERL